MQKLDYSNLERSLIDVIKEEQAKLGYYREDIRLYYPLSSLNHFFKTDVEENEMQKMLEGISGGTKNNLGVIEVSHRGDRFCFHIPPEGVEYVHEHTKENEFIRELVQLVAQHGCTIEEVYQLFTKHSDHVRREPMDNGEFDERIWFEDKEEDPYYYCFKQEGEHMIYHRFLPADYEDFEF